jgi:hypothetical protein
MLSSDLYEYERHQIHVTNNHVSSTQKIESSRKNSNSASHSTPKLQKDATIPTCMVFLHIPKSGGRSVASFLKNVTLDIMNFTIQRTYGSKHVNIEISDLQVNHTITLGHFTTRLFEEEPRFRQCFTITVLREPVDRAISAFYFHGHKSRQIDQCLTSAIEATAKTRRYLKKKPFHGRCRVNWQYSNDMTRRLAGSSDIKWNTRAENKYHMAQPNRTHLESAKANLLSEFDLVCFTHDLPSCAKRVLETFQLDHTDERLSLGLSRMTAMVDPKFKTKSRPNELGEDGMNKFRRANELDTELYKWALDNIN